MNERNQDSHPEELDDHEAHKLLPNSLRYFLRPQTKEYDSMDPFDRYLGQSGLDHHMVDQEMPNADSITT